MHRVVRAASIWAGAALVAHLARELLGERPLAGELFAAVALDFVAGRAKVPWYDGAKRADFLRAFVAALVGVALVALTVVCLWAGGRARPTFAGDALSIVLSIVGSLAIAVRVELLARHLPNALLGPALSPSSRAVLMVVAGAAPIALFAVDRPASIGLALATGATSVVCLRTGGALASVGLRFGLVFGASTVFGGVRWSRGGLSPLDVASGEPALLLAVLALVCAAFVTLRRPALAPGPEPTKPSSTG